VVRVPAQGFELPVPAGWKVERQLTGSGSQVVGVVLVPRSGQPGGAAITVAADDDQPLPFYIVDLQRGASRRADGRLYKLRSGRAGVLKFGRGPVGPYVIAWPVWPDSCRPLPAPAEQPPACARAAWQVLLVTGAAAPGDGAGVQQVLGVMGRIAGTVRPIGNAPAPTRHQGAARQGGQRRGRLGGVDRVADQAGTIYQRRIHGALPARHAQADMALGTGGAVVHPARRRLHADGLPVVAARLRPACVGAGPQDAASVRIELAGRPPVEVSTFGRHQPVPWVGFLSPPLPAGARLERVVALDAAGKTVGTRQRPFLDHPRCRPRAG
jgi:hypothetical protein